MDYELLYPSRFIKAPDLKGQDFTLTISSVRGEKIQGRIKAVMSFVETSKELVLNRTNADFIALMFGREMNAWIGKRITIYPLVMANPFRIEGKTISTCIRVRGSPDIAATAHAPAVAPAPVQAPPPPPQAKASPLVVDVFAGETEDAALERATTRDPFAGNGLDHGHGLNGGGL